MEGADDVWECVGTNSVALFFFFFQAEDGIRDLIVTGVQTCALPISSPSHARHLKCIIGAMRAFLVIVFAAISLQAQSLADFARQERERQAHLKPTDRKSVV